MWAPGWPRLPSSGVGSSGTATLVTSARDRRTSMANSADNPTVPAPDGPGSSDSRGGKVTVTVADDHVAQTGAVAEQLRAAGMNVEQVLDAVGMITGRVPAEQRATIRPARRGRRRGGDDLPAGPSRQRGAVAAEAGNGSSAIHAAGSSGGIQTGHRDESDRRPCWWCSERQPTGTDQFGVHSESDQS